MRVAMEEAQKARIEYNRMRTEHSKAKPLATIQSWAVVESPDLPRFSQPFIAGVSRFRFVGEYISPPS